MWVVIASVVLLLIIIVIWSRSERLVNVSNRVVLFYRPSCPACQQFKPIWDEVKSSLINTTFEEINTEVDDVSAKEYQYGVTIETVPAIFIIKDGVVKKYDGDRKGSMLISAILFTL
jgi:thiol-disulfide isomerase/thioredoxin